MTEFEPNGKAPADQITAANFHSAQRSAPATAILTLIAAVFIGGLAIPKIAATVGVRLAQGVLVVCALLSASLLALLAFYRFGAASKIYRALDYLEGFVLSWSIAYLIGASSVVHSFFWIFFGVQVLMTALPGYSPVYLATVCAAPAYLLALSLWRGETASAWVAAIAGICGIYVYWVIAKLSSERYAALAREAELRLELGRAWVARERGRISRDLHDSVATELTALVWRVREISGAGPESMQKLDIESVAERLRSVIGDLRNVVLALREPEPGLSELELLERRCRELCGATELSLAIDGRVDAAELGVFREQLLPICFELVHNAARHAHARQIELRLKLGQRICIRVSDDGCGLSRRAWNTSQGGLQSVRQRVANLAGAITFEATAAGTQFAIDLPRPLVTSAPELAAS